MSETQKNQQNNNHQSDEIDLKELFKGIGDFFKNILNGFLMIIVGIRNATVKNFKLIFIFGLIGGLAGIALNYVTPDYYSSSMLLKSTHLSGRLMESSIDKLDQLCREQNYQQLSKTLDIELELAQNIRGLHYEPFVAEQEIVELEVFKQQLKNEIDDEQLINQFVEKLKMENKSTYRIFVNVFDNDELSRLEQPILNYFKENPYVAKRLKIQRETLQLEKENLEDELSKLDSLKKIMFKNFNSMAERSRQGSNNVIMGDEKVTDPIAIFEESRDQYQEKLRVQEKLFLEPSFELIDGFTIFAKPKSPGLIKYGFYSGLVGLGIAYIIILLIAFNRYLNTIEEKNKTQRAA